MSTLAARIADALRMHVHPHLSRPIIEEALRKEEPVYSGHVPCSKCGTTHWMHGPCPPSKDEEKKCEKCEKNPAAHEHTCPYREEINDDSVTTCNCCTECMYECQMDI